MAKDIIKTPNAPAAIGPYSQGVIAEGRMVFISGQVSLDPVSGQMIGSTAAEQAEQVMKNLRGALTAGGADFPQVVKTTIFLKSMDDFSAVNEVYARHMSAPYPARATVQVSRLPKDALVEIDAIAVL